MKCNILNPIIGLVYMRIVRIQELNTLNTHRIGVFWSKYQFMHKKANFESSKLLFPKEHLSAALCSEIYFGILFVAIVARP